MAIFNFFRKEKKGREIKTQQQQKVSEHKEELKEKLQKKASGPESPAGLLAKIYPAWKILKEPHITEKAAALSESNEYVFKIYPKANKYQVKKAIEDLYRVKVEGVRIVCIPKKTKRLGRFEGWRKGYKKAIVKVAKGQHIEILPK